VRRTLLTLSLVATAWALLVVASGGFVLQIGSVRLLSSREPRNALIVAVVSALAAAALTPHAERRRLLAEAAGRIRALVWAAARRVSSGVAALLTRRMPSRTGPVTAAVVALAVVLVGIFQGAPYVGGADVYGYVSQSELWAAGRLRVPRPLSGVVDWRFAADALTPLGYRPGADGSTMVPIYAPGYPILMAALALLGGRDAVFFVVPLLGGLAVWATYLMGSRLAGGAVGAVAALMLATSPSFLFQLLLPMSDVPVTAWWALSLALALRDGARAALLSGLAAGVAILTRPNLVPLAIVPALLIAGPIIRTRSLAWPFTRRPLLFAVGSVPGCLFIAFLNWKLYGSPLSIGYGPFEALFSWSNLIPNLQRYPTWLLQTETPVVLVALVAPLLISRVSPGTIAGLSPKTITLAWLAFIVLVFLAYVFHTPNNSWFWLRYVLPAFPALLVLTSTGLVAIVARVDRGVRRAVMGVVLGALAWHGVAFTASNGVFGFKEGERKPLAIGEYIAARLPARAIFICLQHSGSVRYYSGRLTIRFDQIPPDSLDGAIEDLQAINYRPYILLEEWEEPTFTERFGRHNAAGRLDWPAAVLLEHTTKVRIYDPSDRSRSAPDRVPTEIIR
jgi:hypothetical protein